MRCVRIAGRLPARDRRRRTGKKKLTGDSGSDVDSNWNGWRGPNRDGRVAWLPASLPAEPKVLWEVKLPVAGLGGIAANEKYVVFGDRDLDDFQDVYRCYNAQTGKQIWQTEALAIGNLDYGNSPRATPLIDGPRVVFAGAFGDLMAVQLATGKTIWQRQLRTDFGLKAELPWGFCGSPLLVDSKLIVQPGGPDASLVALDPATGDVQWKTAGDAPSYGSLIVGQFGGQMQIVGHDAKTLGGWEVKTGKRLWKLRPPVDGDFNVPTPVAVNGKLLVCTENNGARLYQFRDDATLDPEPIASNARLTPDMSSPVVVGDRVFCVNRLLIGLDLTDELNEVTRLRDRTLGDYGSIIASDTHLLVTGKGELLLVDARDKPRIVSRLRFCDDDVSTYSHPALVGDRLYIRGESSLHCISLKEQ